jgi:hypothetical protein
MNNTSDGHPYVTPSKRVDVGMFALLLVLSVMGSYRLRVYYAVMVGDVHMVRILPDGTRELLPTPASFRRVGGFMSQEHLVEELQQRITHYMHAAATRPVAGPDTRYEWTIRWSKDSLRLDNAQILVFTADEAGTF